MYFVASCWCHSLFRGTIAQFRYFMIRCPFFMNFPSAFSSRKQYTWQLTWCTVRKNIIRGDPENFQVDQGRCKIWWWGKSACWQISWVQGDTCWMKVLCFSKIYPRPSVIRRHRMYNNCPARDCSPCSLPDCSRRKSWRQIPKSLSLRWSPVAE